ncbi:MAG: dienelactone hydrolase family protein [Candidatus Dormibacteraeota bacterium]|uniref:Dienelactone hydrolase family protein n=1 Tax=Candidatus Amunia macphersoniae TaxID=3127014 RepID=A0A934N945_9BACT|nr:dienelactone hydrolase family protein [Candidatus Dormibacteraeota bacterium]
MGEMIEFAGDGHVDRGYLAVPSSGSGPGVVVIQEWWGLVGHIKDLCDRFARAGFTALAPDLYHGTSTTEPDEAEKEMMNLDIADAARDLFAAVRHLLDSPQASGRSVGVVGFCMGGGLALNIASQEPEIAACVAYYGVGPAREVIDFSAMRAAVLGHWGERDHSYDRSTVEDLQTRLRGAGVSVESFWYDADHAFFNDDRPEVYNADAAQLSWDRTLAFLGEHLRG